MSTRPLTIVNQLGSAVECCLRDHWSKPIVISLPPESPPWEIPYGTDVLLTSPRGWVTAPPSAPPQFSTIRWVQCDSVGLDPYPDWLLGGRIFTNASGSNAVPVAEYAIGAILALEKNIPECWIENDTGWQPMPMGSLEGKTLGIAGFGAVGRALAKRAAAFDMKVIAFRRSTWEGENGVAAAESLPTLFTQSDHVVLAMPATAETRRCVSKSVLACAKPGLHLINVSRGALIDDDALLWALDSGYIARASLDVTDPEPLPTGHRYYTHPQVRLTPHVAWDGQKNARRMQSIIMENLDVFVQGGRLYNVVDLLSGY